MYKVHNYTCRRNIHTKKKEVKILGEFILHAYLGYLFPISLSVHINLATGLKVNDFVDRDKTGEGWDVCTEILTSYI